MEKEQIEQSLKFNQDTLKGYLDLSKHLTSDNHVEIRTIIKIDTYKPELKREKTNEDLLIFNYHLPVKIFLNDIDNKIKKLKISIEELEILLKDSENK